MDVSRTGPDLTWAGVDEAGRGPLAGPVVVAAVLLNPNHPIPGLADSKTLTLQKRLTLEAQILAHTRHAIIFVPPDEIDRLNILRATLAGMARALEAIGSPPAIVDGTFTPPGHERTAIALPKADALHPQVSAASILAKCARDRTMIELDAEFPGYGFADHKGYPSPVHLEALRRLGPCPHHRKSFAPVREFLEQRSLFDLA
jgi:ribonuclease HII